MNPIAPFSRRQFLSDASRLSALYALAGSLPFSAFASSVTPSLLDDPRISRTPVADAGFASVRKIGDGLYATISDTSKGIVTICNGGFLVGKDAGLLLEAYGSVPGAAFQMDTYRKATKVPAPNALLTHYHFDHSTGSAFYGANGIQLWGHAAVPKRIMESYVVMQGADRAAFLAPALKRIKDAKNEIARQHAQGDLGAISNLFDLVNKNPYTLPDHPLDPAKLPMNLDLGACPIVIEHFPGHSGTDLIVRVPDQKVVYAGDLVFSHAYPACFDEKCTMSGWRKTLQTFASWDKDTLFVPGHGPVCGQEGIRDLRDLFDDLYLQAEKMHQAGVPLPDATDQYVIPEKFKTYAVFAWGFCIAGAISKIYAEMVTG
jgi:glyoxylase-like metal-dependent hydrolase (beta-lactamase superfamily II)